MKKYHFRMHDFSQLAGGRCCVDPEYLGRSNRGRRDEFGSDFGQEDRVSENTWRGGLEQGANTTVV